MTRANRFALAASAAWALTIAATAAGAAPVTPPEPTYADVLAHPDDAALNMAYALKLVRDGHLNPAAATLERVLLLNPEADDVRVTYMIVLYRLDDMAGAKREADVLATRTLSGPLAAEYQRYASRINALAKPTRFSAYLGTGVRVDSNVTYLTDETGAKPKKDGDVALQSMAGIGFEHRPDSGPIDSVFAMLDVGARRNAEYTEYDAMNARAEAGVESRWGGLVGRASGFVSTSFLDRDLYAREAGGRLRLSYEFNPFWSAFVDGEGAQVRYSDIPIASDERAHDGPRWRAGGGVILQATDQHQFVLQGHWADKQARDDAYAYTAYDVEASWLGTFFGGQYMSASTRYAWYDYRAEDTAYGETRADRSFRARLSYGLPVRTIASWVGLDTSGFFFNFGELVLQTSVDYLHQTSNIADFDHSNVGGDVMLTRRFQF